MMIVLTKLNVYAGNAPNATMKYEYSAPEDGIIVPNSAYERAPERIQLSEDDVPLQLDDLQPA